MHERHCRSTNEKEKSELTRPEEIGTHEKENEKEKHERLVVGTGDTVGSAFARPP